MEEIVKKPFEEPTVQKVEVDFKSRIATSGSCFNAGSTCSVDLN